MVAHSQLSSIALGKEVKAQVPLSVVPNRSPPEPRISSCAGLKDIHSSEVPAFLLPHFYKIDVVNFLFYTNLC